MTGVLESGRVIDRSTTTGQGMLLDDSISEPGGKIIYVDFDRRIPGVIIALAEHDGSRFSRIQREVGVVEFGGGIGDGGGIEQGAEKSKSDQSDEEGDKGLLQSRFSRHCENSDRAMKEDEKERVGQVG